MFSVESKPNEKDLLAAIQLVKAKSPARIRVVFLVVKPTSKGTSTYDHANEIMEFHVEPKDGFYNSFLKSGKLSQRLINRFYPAIQHCTKVRIEAISGDRYDN